MDNQVYIPMGWSPYLSVNDRYDRRGRPRLRPQVEAWQEELGWRAKIQLSQRGEAIPENAALVVDIEMRFPDDGKVRDADNYLKAIFDGLEMGLGVNDSRFIPYVRSVEVVPAPQAGFIIRVYPAHFGGRGLTGQIAEVDGDMVIVLDYSLPEDWVGSRVCIDLGVIMEEGQDG
jgi:Holliday junction resolvase RusA-like endonuclease